VSGSIPSVLYHFTCIDSVEGVRREGITRGFIPLLGASGTMQLRPGWAWLTEDPDPARQTWIRTRAEGAACDRSEFRFAVDPAKCVRLTRWLDHPVRAQARTSWLRDFELYPDVVARWWLARCPVPAEALRLETGT